MKRNRRLYENVALVAVRKTRQLVLFWARRCRKSTTLGNISFDEMAGSPGRTVIAASATLLLGKELVGMTLSATEQAAIVAGEAAAVRAALEDRSDGKDGKDGTYSLQVADASRDKILKGLTPEDYAELYKSTNMERRLYFDRTLYCRLTIIAPKPAPARGWGGTVLRDEAGYTPVGLENELRIATKPIMDTDPTFKLIYACNLCPNDRHPFFEMTMPPADSELSPKAEGNFYRGQNGILVHRVTLADAYAAGHVLYDDTGRPLTLAEFRRLPGNKLGLKINYDLEHESGGTAAIDLMALLSAQRRGAGQCAFVFADDDADYRRGLELLRGLLRNGRVGIGFDVASTTGETSNPSSITVTEQIGLDRFQRLVLLFKSKRRAVMSERLRGICLAVRQRTEGGPARRLCIDASNEKLAAEETRDDLTDLVPVELVVSSVSVQPPGYNVAINYKTYLGDIYSTAVNDNHYAMPADEYIKQDQRMPMKDQGRYVCTPDADGKHGDTFDSGKQAEWALQSSAGLTSMTGVYVGQTASGPATGSMRVHMVGPWMKV